MISSDSSVRECLGKKANGRTIIPREITMVIGAFEKWFTGRRTVRNEIEYAITFLLYLKIIPPNLTGIPIDAYRGLAINETCSFLSIDNIRILRNDNKSLLYTHIDRAKKNIERVNCLQSIARPLRDKCLHFLDDFCGQYVDHTSFGQKILLYVYPYWKSHSLRILHIDQFLFAGVREDNHYEEAIQVIPAGQFKDTLSSPEFRQSIHTFDCTRSTGMVITLDYYNMRFLISVPGRVFTIGYNVVRGFCTSSDESKPQLKSLMNYIIDTYIFFTLSWAALDSVYSNLHNIDVGQERLHKIYNLEPPDSLIPLRTDEKYRILDLLTGRCNRLRNAKNKTKNKTPSFAKHLSNPTVWDFEVNDAQGSVRRKGCEESIDSKVKVGQITNFISRVYLKYNGRRGSIDYNKSHDIATQAFNHHVKHKTNVIEQIEQFLCPNNAAINHSGCPLPVQGYQELLKLLRWGDEQYPSDWVKGDDLETNFKRGSKSCIPLLRVFRLDLHVVENCIKTILNHVGRVDSNITKHMWRIQGGSNPYLEEEEEEQVTRYPNSQVDSLSDIQEVEIPANESWKYTNEDDDSSHMDSSIALRIERDQIDFENKRLETEISRLVTQLEIINSDIEECERSKTWYHGELGQRKTEIENLQEERSKLAGAHDLLKKKLKRINARINIKEVREIDAKDDKGTITELEAEIERLERAHQNHLTNLTQRYIDQRDQDVKKLESEVEKIKNDIGTSLNNANSKVKTLNTTVINLEKEKTQLELLIQDQYEKILDLRSLIRHNSRIPRNHEGQNTGIDGVAYYTT